ncbi:hypothetical protein C3747_41g122 [Trypanosoma cruzi]|nr:hypothetical protein, conserved [Trypanosoma cruzi]PBJ80619.1 hypothetical protein BCY84_00803 [Trypanosoma cruzi cruzi]EAN94788.1 hypothetical protein, conserved [Trypanosoma cruzi]KAF8295230.1 hypothetical protein TcYC6_0094920 [Trypanosoma cruzi]PWU91592.1 hypothetical protein C4B63_42g1177c [Trypanosoma cruzi]PWV06596.1 hypothetical protein C3747_113g519c [Trypanosoma cruzi]|eukprot:XP_816639.1 hypothetical protein [Trypanosoma cruzi strain CL Brener]
MLRRGWVAPVVGQRFSPLRLQNRRFGDKIVVGSCAALSTSVTILGIFHLIVTPVSPAIAAATLSAAAVSGALVVFEGGKNEGGTTFGAVIGVFFGAMGGYYAKSSKEPWRK